jgi:hypothetical protein
MKSRQQKDLEAARKYANSLDEAALKDSIRFNMSVLDFAVRVGRFEARHSSQRYDCVFGDLERRVLLLRELLIRFGVELRPRLSDSRISDSVRR